MTKSDLWNMLRIQIRVLHALMLRDLKTRFFGNYFGFLISIGWPLTHILILLLLNAVMGRLAPYGESAALWFATGIIPFMAFNYMARFIMLGIVLNRPLLSFPTVHIADIIFSRAIVEIVSAGTVVVLLLIIFSIFGIEYLPLNITEAFFALGASMLLGLGVGMINAIIAAAIPTWIMGYTLFSIVMWIASGVMFVPSTLPANVRDILSLNPALQCVEWMRSAYYIGYGNTVLDKQYLMGFSLMTLFIALALERMFRGRLLQG